MDGGLIFGIVFGVALVFIGYQINKAYKKNSSRPNGGRQEGESEDADSHKPL